MSDTKPSSVAQETGVLTLESWRVAQALTYEALAQRLGVSLTTAWAYCQPPGHRRALMPRLPTLQKIIALTKGSVSAASFLPQREAA